MINKEQQRMLPAANFMRENWRRGPSLGEIARTVHYSPFYFHREFHRIMGLTPKRFMLDLQIQKAKACLLERMELGAIARECGFAQQSHFSNRFKMVTGQRPTQWRAARAHPNAKCGD